MARDGMDWEKKREVKFIFASEAAGKFCGLRNTLQMHRGFLGY